jgi:hypothetical protein
MTIGQHVAHRQAVRGQRELAGIGTLDGRRLLPRRVHRGDVFDPYFRRPQRARGGRQLAAMIDSDRRLRSVQALTEKECYRKQVATDAD